MTITQQTGDKGCRECKRSNRKTGLLRMGDRTGSSYGPPLSLILYISRAATLSSPPERPEGAVPRTASRTGGHCVGWDGMGWGPRGGRFNDGRGQRTQTRTQTDEVKFLATGRNPTAPRNARKPGGFLYLFPHRRNLHTQLGKMVH